MKLTKLLSKIENHSLMVESFIDGGKVILGFENMKMLIKNRENENNYWKK